MDNIAENAILANSKESESLSFGIYASEAMLREAAETTEGGEFTGTVGEMTVLRLKLESCGLSLGKLEAITPSALEIAEDIYWDAMEKLGALSLGFDVLFDFYCENAGGEA